MQLTTGIILSLEKNNNLSTLRFGVERWMKMAENSNIFDKESVMLATKVGGRKVEQFVFLSFLI